MMEGAGCRAHWQVRVRGDESQASPARYRDRRAVTSVTSHTVLAACCQQAPDRHGPGLPVAGHVGHRGRHGRVLVIARLAAEQVRAHLISRLS